MQPLSEVEKEYILAVLELNDGNQTRTVEQLGIGSATLYRKLKKYGLIGQSPNGPSETTNGSKPLTGRWPRVAATIIEGAGNKEGIQGCIKKISRF